MTTYPHGSQGPAVDSTSDERRVLTDLEKAYMKEIKDMGRDFIGHCDQIGSSREMSIAKTKMEEAVMWAVKHITA